MLLLYVVAPLAAAVWAGWYVTLARVETLTERRLQEEIELIARALSVPLSRALDEGSTSQLQLALQGTEGIQRVYGAYVYDAGGEIVAALGVPPAPDERPSPRITAAGDTTSEYGERGGRRIYSYFVPLVDPGGRVAGVLEVTRRRSEIEEYISAVRRQAAAALASFTLVMVALVWWGHHRALGRHVERLANDMARVSEGDRQHRARLDGFQEITALSGSLNTMLDGIERSQRQLDEQRAARAALERRLGRSETLAAIGGLAVGVAHELGAPLSVVRGRAQRLLRDAGATETIAREAGEIQNQVVRMEAIVRQLLDFGRRRSSEPRLASIGDVVERAGAAARELASGARIEVTLDLPTTEARMLDDPAGLELALGNLLRNALDASPEGTVLLTASATPDAVRITVDDDGPGVPEAIRARVFEPFFTTKSVGEGTGLGLALAHRTIEDMGARLDVESSPLGGARFTITVPADGLLEARG